MFKSNAKYLFYAKDYFKNFFPRNSCYDLMINTCLDSELY